MLSFYFLHLFWHQEPRQSVHVEVPEPVAEYVFKNAFSVREYPPDLVPHQVDIHPEPGIKRWSFKVFFNLFDEHIWMAITLEHREHHLLVFKEKRIEQPFKEVLKATRVLFESDCVHLLVVDTLECLGLNHITEHRLLYLYSYWSARKLREYAEDRNHIFEIHHVRECIKEPEQS